ncbi:unnamed protein product [Caenorhabditis bovis]|uniref:Uncharacterized protein n=1 Tax=Caenorhabditis bovis TaxID=2654633 RepID=A0A8S1F4E6_9PELO|nr:unnamed protein product [Caenorhabditis bovis]
MVPNDLNHHLRTHLSRLPAHPQEWDKPCYKHTIDTIDAVFPVNHPYDFFSSLWQIVIEEPLIRDQTVIYTHRKIDGIQEVRNIIGNNTDNLIQSLLLCSKSTIDDVMSMHLDVVIKVMPLTTIYFEINHIVEILDSVLPFILVNPELRMKIVGWLRGGRHVTSSTVGEILLPAALINFYMGKDVTKGRSELLPTIDEVRTKNAQLVRLIDAIHKSGLYSAESILNAIVPQFVAYTRVLRGERMSGMADDYQSMLRILSTHFGDIPFWNAIVEMPEIDVDDSDDYCGAHRATRPQYQTVSVCL